MIKRLVTAVEYVVISVLLSVLAFVMTSMISGNGNPLGFQNPLAATNLVAARAPFADAPKLTEAQKVSFVQGQRAAAGYDGLSANGKATWDTVASVLYGKLGAYQLHFELTDDPAKNCAQLMHHSQGGCYQQGGSYDKMIYISPDIDEPNAEFISYHEYSHYLQDREGHALGSEGLKKHTRFSADPECDADLRALQLRGSWVPGFEHQCLADGFTVDQLTLENLPNLEAQLKESTYQEK